MFLKQFYLGCLAHASYMIGDEESRAAVIVDPRRDIDEYLAEADARGLRIERVILTHFHADFVAGHIELRDRVGAEIFLGAKAEADYAFTRLYDGDIIEFGKTKLQALETPGHTPEGISILVFDLEKDTEEPHAVLTGDTLFIGDVGRPDLMTSVGVSAEQLAHMLYDSLHQKLLPLPDETIVYPAHGAGSLCGKSLSTDTSSTMGVQRQYNYALQPMSREEFVRLVTVDQSEVPAYFSYDADLNRRERPTLDSALESELIPLSLEEVLRMKNAGAQVIDVRDPGEFAAAHLVDTMELGLGGQYATWAGTLLSRERPIVIIAEPGREEEAAIRLGRVGFDNMAGYLDGGMGAVQAQPDLIERFERLAPATLAERLHDPAPPFLLDVRRESEYEMSRIEGSLNIPLSHLDERVNGLPRDREIVIYCAGGYRSAIAASLLMQHGLRKVSDLVGGFKAWDATVVTPTA